MRIIVRGVRLVPFGDFDLTLEIWELLTVLTDRDLLALRGVRRVFQWRGVGSSSCLALHRLPHLHLPARQYSQTFRLPRGVLGVTGAVEIPFPPPLGALGDRPGAS